MIFGAQFVDALAELVDFVVALQVVESGAHAGGQGLVGFFCLWSCPLSFIAPLLRLLMWFRGD